MDFSQIRTLLHVIELGSLRKAAERLRIAQPALSRQIRLLEEELGAPLFVRHGRGMHPTELACGILDPARDIVARLADIRRLADIGMETHVGRVRLGMTPTVAEVMTLPLTHAVTRDHPHLSLSFTTGYSGHLIDWLKRDLLDCCVSYDADPTNLMEVQPVLEEALLLVGRADAGLVLETPVSFKDLHAMQLILPSPLHGLRRILDAAASRAGFALAPRIEIDSFGATIDLVRDGFGIAILPLASVHRQVEAGLLSVAPLCDPAPVRRVVIAYQLDRAVPPAARMIGRIFAEIAADLIASKAWSGKILAVSL